MVSLYIMGVIIHESLENNKNHGSHRFWARSKHRFSVVYRFDVGTRWEANEQGARSNCRAVIHKRRNALNVSRALRGLSARYFLWL
jgi:hypothetical protein